MFTLRSSGDEDEVDSTETESPYSELTKFLPELEQLVSTDATSNDTRQLREDLTESFRPYLGMDADRILAGKTVADLESPAFAKTANADEALAAIHKLLTLESMLPGQLHRLAVSGALRDWLRVLAR